MFHTYKWIVAFNVKMSLLCQSHWSTLSNNVFLMSWYCLQPCKVSRVCSRCLFELHIVPQLFPGDRVCVCAHRWMRGAWTATFYGFPFKSLSECFSYSALIVVCPHQLDLNWLVKPTNCVNCASKIPWDELERWLQTTICGGLLWRHRLLTNQHMSWPFLPDIYFSANMGIFAKDE